jgi:hypothetical protein
VPNHELNNVVVIGKPENIRLFTEMAFVHPGEAFPRSPEETNDKDFPLLDFDLVVPEPANIEKGGCSGTHPEGVVCWYEWHLNNWGTKWGAYHHDHYELRYFNDEGNGVYARLDLTFETAWSQPTPILEAIEKRWNLVVHAVTQDEGGFPDVEYGNPYGEEVIRKVTTFEFDSYDRAVEAPSLNPDSVGAGFPEEAAS